METGPRGNLFRAYTEQQRASRFRLRYVLVPVVVLLVAALGYAVVTFKQEATPYRVETPWGVRTVRLARARDGLAAARAVAEPAMRHAEVHGLGGQQRLLGLALAPGP